MISSSIIKPILIALGAFIAVIINLIFKLEYGFISVITVFVLLQLFYADIYQKMIERVVGSCVAFLLTLLIIKAFHTHYFIVFCLTTFVTLLFMYYYAIGKFSYAMLLGGITAAFMSATAYSISIDKGIEIGFFWTLNIIIGSFIVFVISLIWKQIDWKESKITFSNSLKQMKQTWKELTTKNQFDLAAFLIALRITLTLLIVLTINHFMGWAIIDPQAVIAGTVVTAQLSVSQSNQRAIVRIIGVIGGAGLALFYSKILAIFPYQTLNVGLIVITLALFSFIGTVYPLLEYGFLQAGMMIPLILLSHTQGFVGSHLALLRTFGSIEGGIVGILMVYLSFGVFKYMQSQ